MRKYQPRKFSAARLIRRGVGRSELNGSLSRRNTASHRCRDPRGPLYGPARTQGAPPPSAPGGPGRRCVLSPSFVKNLQKSKTARRNANRRQKSPIDSLRRHYPRQVKGRSVRFLSAFRLPCFSPPAYHRGKILSRGLQIRAEKSMIGPQ